MTSPTHDAQPPMVALESLTLRLYYNLMSDDRKHQILDFAQRLIEEQRAERREDRDLKTCVNAHILRDDVNAGRFVELCRRTFGLCDEGQPCPPVSTDARILLVSSERGLTSTPSSADRRKVCGTRRTAPEI